MEDAIMSTPQGPRNNMHSGNQMAGQMNNNVVPWLPDASPAVSSLSSFRTRPRKQPRKKLRGLLGLGFKPTTSASLSKSPPSSAAKEKRDAALAHPRRESISWAANQLHISSSEAEEKAMDGGDVLNPSGKDGQRGVVKRVVTRRGNLFVSYSFALEFTRRLLTRCEAENQGFCPHPCCSCGGEHAHRRRSTT